MSRLERLVSLLDTGSSAYVRNVAGDQLADVQKAHPEELYGLLARVIPFLQSSKWDTRIASARAIGLIVENYEWDPEAPAEPVKVEEAEALDTKAEPDTQVKLEESADPSVKVEPGVKLEEEEGETPIKQEAKDVDMAAVASAPPMPTDLLSFASLDIKNVILNGVPLQRSAGKEYEASLQGMDAAQRLAAQQQALKKTLGIAGEFSNTKSSGGDDDDLLLDDDLDLAPPPPKKGKRGRKPKKLEPEPEPEVEPQPETPTEAAPVNARMRALAKRKARFASKQPNKVHISDKKKDNGAEGGNSNSKDSVTVEFKPNKAAEMAEFVTVKDPNAWPFEALCGIFAAEILSPQWETRHGALLGLREVLKTHGAHAGMHRLRTPEENKRANSEWLEDLACRLCCIFALDRFADYVADQVVAPIRESCAQTLGALLLCISVPTAEATFSTLESLVLQKETLGLEEPLWAVCHGGMLGLRYLVSVRTDILVQNPKIFDKLIKCVFHGLENSDDDVQAISAAALLPIAEDFVKQRPQDIAKLLAVIWDSLGELKDELSTSIGNVMDLLAKLCSFDDVLKVLMETMGSTSSGSYADLIPRLYPFLRHSITDVRKAVLRTLRIFLSIESSEALLSWIDLRFFRLLFQNIMLEQKPEIAKLSVDLWLYLCDTLSRKPEYAERLRGIWATFAPIAVQLAMTPIGTSRRFYKVEPKLLIKPSGATVDSHEFDGKTESRSNHHVNIDGPVLLGDVLIVDPDVFIRARVDCASAIGKFVACLPASEALTLANMLTPYFNSPMSSQHLVAALILEEYGKRSKENANPVPPSSELTEIVIPYLKETMDSASEAIYRDLNPILRAVRTQCQSLFSLMASEGNLPSSMLPQMPTAIEGDVNAGPTAFNLAYAEVAATKTFKQLKESLSDDLQVSMEKTLEEGRQNLENAITEAKESLQKRNISMKSSAAAAFISLADDLPAKLNPIIRSLMDGIKMETNAILHSRVAATVSDLIATLLLKDRATTANKVVKNLCSFVCVDTSEAPVFSTHKTKDGILSLKADAPVEDILEELKRKKETELALVKRTGAILTLQNLAQRFGSNLFSSLQDLELKVIKGLSVENISKQDKQDDAAGQYVIDNLAVLSAILPFLDNGLYPAVETTLEDIKYALFSDYAVVRYTAAKTFSTICKVMPTVGITFFVEEILPQVSNGRELHKRQGAVETTYHIMMNMGERVLPYIVFFIVPILGRMSDPNHAVRTIAATTFAAIIKLVPLESGIEDPEDMPAKLLEGREKERDFIAQMMDISKVKPFEMPVNIKATLRKYQQEGVNWLAFLNKYHLHGILCDDMGLGKTLQTICIVASDHHIRLEEYKRTERDEFRTLPSLIICPTTLTGHWIQEFRKYAPDLEVLGYVGSPSSRAALTRHIKKVDVVVTSYDIARNDADALSKFNYNYCVLDEGHIIKNAHSKLSRAVKRYMSEHRLVLSGTPIQNNVLELWSLFDFLMPGFLGTEKSFNENFSKPIIASRNSSKSSSKEQEMAALALEALHKQVLPFMLRRLKEDVLNDLPPKIIQDYYCDLNEKQRKLYEQFTVNQKKTVEEDLKDDDKEAKKHIFQALLYMRRLCNHPSFVTLTKPELEKAQPLDYAQSPKLLALQQLLKDCGIGINHAAAKTEKGEIPEAMSQHRALVFCQQKDMLDLVENSLLRANMPSVSYMRLDSSVSGPARHEMVTKFNEDPSIDLLLLSTHVGGLGLNLTGADTVIFVEHDWNPMNDLQAMDRAHRIGQKKVVNVYRLITRNTLEERIMGLQEFKLNIASTVVNQQNNGLHSMDTDQILDLFSASTEAAVSEEPSKKPEDALGATGTLGEKNITSELGELWDDTQYAEEYDLDNFIKGLKKK